MRLQFANPYSPVHNSTEEMEGQDRLVGMLCLIGAGIAETLHQLDLINFGAAEVYQYREMAGDAARLAPMVLDWARVAWDWLVGAATVFWNFLQNMLRRVWATPELD